MKHKIIVFFTMVASSIFYGQMDSYSYKNEINEISDTWHKLTLPNEVLSQLNPLLTDVRIYGITKTDTVETPYLLKIKKEKKTTSPINFEYLNYSKNSNDYFYTYKIPKKETINRIHLDFKQLNFDWLVTLEGSHNQQEWFTILNDYRIIGITKDEVQYRYTTLQFPNSDYTFYRISIKSDVQPILDTAGILLDKTEPAQYHTYQNINMTSYEINKNTIIELELDEKVPVSSIKLSVDEEYQYHRPLKIEYIVDSIQTEKGVKYKYQALGNYTLSSVADNVFNFKSVLAKKLRVTILNFDNTPLHIKKSSVKGFVHMLVARFTEPAKYYLVYGKQKAKKANYDISNLKIPATKKLASLSLAHQETIPKMEIKVKTPLFENELWLWAIMGVIILVLGYFTLQMIQKKDA